ncbi:MAG: shpI [Planctomycetota bacterium]|nr:shpI [Planctomycetota bacterium]
MPARRPKVYARRTLDAIVTGLAALAALAGLARPAIPRDAGEGAWPVGTPRPIAVRAGAATFVVPSGSAGSRTLIVVSSLSRKPGAYPIRISARPADRAQSPILAEDGAARTPSLPPPLPLTAEPTAPGWSPPAARTFHLPVRDGDLASPSNYVSVTARLRGFGRAVQVYVDPADLGRVDEATVRDVVATFDDRVLPRARQTIGTARDIDGDGRFTVLFSGWLGHLADGKLAVDGFVRGSDFEIGQPSPLGNRCDMMYLSASLAAGPHLRTVVAHEYTHAVTYCRKALRPAGGDEEGWLDEALAHLAEDLHGFSRSNLDYRVAAFLAAPERYRLLVDDYGTADLIRSHGHRGSAYRFLRWCADHYGPDLLGTLIRSDRRGVANLEAATGMSFAALYRGWSVGLFLDAMRPNESQEDRVPPRFARLTPGGEDDVATLDGTTSHFTIVDGATSAAVAITVTGPPGAEIQVTAVRLPEDYPRVDLDARVEPGSDGRLLLRVRLRERDGREVAMESLQWSPEVPPADRARRPGSLTGEALVKAFGRDRLSGHDRIAAAPIPLAAGTGPGPLVVRFVGHDAKGRRVVGQAECEAIGRPSRD